MKDDLQANYAWLVWQKNRCPLTDKAVFRISYPSLVKTKKSLFIVSFEIRKQ